MKTCKTGQTERQKLMAKECLAAVFLRKIRDLVKRLNRKETESEGVKKMHS